MLAGIDAGGVDNWVPNCKTDGEAFLEVVLNFPELELATRN